MTVHAAIEPLDEAAMAAARAHLDRLTKPPGSLGRLERLVVQLAGISGSPTPRVDRPAVVVFAGDHGVTARGVSAYPSDVTAQMVANFVAWRGGHQCPGRRCRGGARRRGCRGRRSGRRWTAGEPGRARCRAPGPSPDCRRDPRHDGRARHAPRRGARGHGGRATDRGGADRRRDRHDRRRGDGHREYHRGERAGRRAHGSASGRRDGPRDRPRRRGGPPEGRP